MLSRNYSGASSDSWLSRGCFSWQGSRPWCHAQALESTCHLWQLLSFTFLSYVLNTVNSSWFFFPSCLGIFCPFSLCCQVVLCCSSLSASVLVLHMVKKCSWQCSITSAKGKKKSETLLNSALKLLQQGLSGAGTLRVWSALGMLCSWEAGCVGLWSCKLLALHWMLYFATKGFKYWG